MILIGQYDSSFVRRVALALRIYGLPFEHRPWSSFGDAGQIRAYNPLTRVPTLVLDDGEALVDSHMILDYLDGLMPADRAMFPRTEPDRRKALRIAALATGMADKAVALFYELHLHEKPSDVWVGRCRAQIEAALAVLEEERAKSAGPHWFGGRIGHADIAVACALRHLDDAHPGLVSMDAYPALKAHAARLEAMPVFQTISQPFVAPA